MLDDWRSQRHRLGRTVAHEDGTLDKGEHVGPEGDVLERKMHRCRDMANGDDVLSIALSSDQHGSLRSTHFD